MSKVIKKQEHRILEMKRGQCFKVEENHLRQVLMVTLKKQRIRGVVALRRETKRDTWWWHSDVRLRGGTQWAP